LIVRESKNGRGVFTTESIKKDSSILKVLGVKKTVAEIEVDGIFSSLSANAYRFSKTHYISPEGKLGELLNHSCEPNAYVTKEHGQLFVKAINSIRARVQVVIDYSTIMARDDEWIMTCNCGSKKCRGLVTKFTLLPEAIQRQYREKRIVPDYILSI
jgi:SET domain-containing protein